MFQMVDATAEKVCLLGPIRWNSFTDGTYNMPLLPEPDGMDRYNREEAVP